MTTVLVNRLGIPPSTKRATDRLDPSATVYDKDAVERRILFVTSDDERLWGTISYSGVHAEALLHVAAQRPPLPESPRTLQ